MKRNIHTTIQILRKKRRVFILALTLPLIVILGTALVISLRIAKPADAAPWMDDSWGYRTKYPITNSSGSAQTDFQAMLTVDTATLVTAGKMLSSCNDIRITDISGKSLPVWVEPTTCNTASTKVWTKVPSISTSGADIYLYYGNPSASSSSSTNGTFIREMSGAAAAWPFDDTTSTQSYARVVNPAVATGRNMVINGTFDTDTIWTKGTNWSITGGKAVATAAPSGGTGNLSQAIPMVVGKAYQITYTISGYSSGTIRVLAGNGGVGTSRTANGTYTETIICVSQSTLTFQVTVDFTGNIDDVSVTQVNIPDNSATPTQLLTDGNMETVGTAAWTAVNSATLSKQTTSPHGGSQVLRIAYNGVTAPTATQSVLTVGNVYRVTGYGRGDGGYTWRLSNGANIPFSGTISTAWQPFDFTFVAVNNVISFTSMATGAGYVEFDDVVVSLDTGIRQGEVWDDGNMETAGVTSWVAGSGSTLTKQSGSPHGGTQSLRVTYGGSGNNWAYQTDVLIGKKYRITGWFRGDGAGLDQPSVSFCSSGVALVQGTNSNTWQFFDTVGIADSNCFLLRGNGAAATNYVEFDDVSITEVDPLVAVPGNGVTLGSTANGHLSNAYTFDGTNDVVNLYSSDLNSVLGSTEGTVVVWAKVANSGVWTDGIQRSIVGLRVDANNEFSAYKATATNQINMSLTVGGNGVTRSTSTSTTGWFQIVLTWNKSKDQIIHYFNGAQVGATQTGLGTWTGNLSSSLVLAGAGTTGGGTPWSGMINDVRVYSRALSPAEISDQYSASSDVQAYTTSNYRGKELLRKFNSSVTLGAAASEEKGGAPVAYWAFDEGTGTLTRDQTKNNVTGIVTNMASPATAASGWQTEDKCISGKCLAFDGTNDYVNVGDVAPAKLTTTGSAEVWIRPNAYPGANTWSTVLNKGNWGAGRNYYAIYFEQSTNALRFDLGNGSTFNPISIANTSAPLNQWSHLSMTWDGTTIRAYINGKQVGTATQTVTPDTSTYSLQIGAANTNYYFNGFIDEPKIFNYARSAAQIKADFDARKTNEGASLQLAPNQKSLSDGLVAYYKMDETSWTVDCSTASVLDSSGVGNNAKACPNSTGPTGGAIGKYGNSANFDASNDYIDTGKTFTSTFQNSFSVSFWMKPSSGNTFSSIWGNSEAFPYIAKAELQADGTVDFLFTTPAGSTTARTNTAVFGAGAATTWSHIVIVGDDTKRGPGGFSIYVNGQQAVLNSSSNGNTAGLPFSGYAAVNNIYLGARDTGGASQFYGGGLDEFRIYNRALSSQDVRSLYGFAPGPVGYWKMDEGSWTNDCSTSSVLDSSGNGFNALACPGGTGSTGGSTGKFGKAGYFDGSDDELRQSSVSSFAYTPISNSFTLSAWVNMSTIQRGVVITKNAAYGLIIDATGHPYIYEGNGGDSVVSSTVLATKTWYHLSAVFDGNTAKLYINGKLDSTGTITIGSPNQGNALIIGGITIPTFYFNGYIDEAKIYNYPRSQQQIVEDMQGGRSDSTLTGSVLPAPYAYYKFNEGAGTAANNSGYGGSGLNASLTNMASPATATSGWNPVGKQGKALNFDGGNDFVNVYSSNLNSYFNGSEGTVSAWAKMSNVGTWTDANTRRIFNIEADDNNRVIIMKSADNTIQASYIAGSTVKSVTTTTFGGNTSYLHFVLTWNKALDQMKLYVNGNQIGATQTGLGTWAGSLASTKAVVGARSTTGNEGWSGQIDDVKIYNSALSSDQVLQDYNSGSALTLGSTNNATESATLTDGAGSAPIGYWNFDEKLGTTANDTSGNNFTGTMTNGPTWLTGKYGSAINFDGVDDYLTVAHSATLNSYPITVSAWFKTTVSNASQLGIVNKYVASSLNGYSIQIVSGKVQAWYFKDGSNNVYSSATLLSPLLYNDNRWHQATLVVDANGGTLYMDGTNVINKPWTGTPGATTTTQPLHIGDYPTGIETNFFPGSIDDVKMYGYARTPAQIAYDYNRGGPIAWWKMNECQGATINDSSGNNISGTLTVGATGTQTAIGTCNTATTAWGNGSTGKYNGSVNFDGTDDYVSMGDPTILRLNGSLTLSAWVYRNGVTTNPVMVSKALHAGSSGYYLDWSTGAGNLIRFGLVNGTTTSIVSSPFAVSSGNWYHLVGTFDSATMLQTLYINGKRVSQTTSSILPSGTNSIPLTLGSYNAGASNLFNGQIDDVKIFNYALSTAQVQTLFNNAESVFFGPVSGSP